MMTQLHSYMVMCLQGYMVIQLQKVTRLNGYNFTWLHSYFKVTRLHGYKFTWLQVTWLQGTTVKMLQGYIVTSYMGYVTGLQGYAITGLDGYKGIIG